MAAQETLFSSPFSLYTFQPKWISYTTMLKKRNSSGSVSEGGREEGRDGRRTRCPCLPSLKQSSLRGLAKRRALLLPVSPLASWALGARPKSRTCQSWPLSQPFCSSFWIAKTGPSYSYQRKQFSFCPSCCPCAGTRTVAFGCLWIFMFPEYIIMCKHKSTRKVKLCFWRCTKLHSSPKICNNIVRWLSQKW